MHTFILLTTAALLTLASANQGQGGNNDISTVFTTMTVPGVNFGVGENVPAATITGTATIDDGVTVLIDGETVYMIGTGDVQNIGRLSGTNVMDGVTVVNGQIVGAPTAATTRDDDGNAATTTPTGGAMRAKATAEVLGLLGLGAMAALVV